MIYFPILSVYFNNVSQSQFFIFYILLIYYILLLNFIIYYNILITFILLHLLKIFL